MGDPSDSPADLRYWIDRLMTGDPEARNQILELTYQQVQGLVHKILCRYYPGMRQRHDTNSVHNRVNVKILPELEILRQIPAEDREFLMDVPGFFRWIARRIHQVCLDLARKEGRDPHVQLGGQTSDSSSGGTFSNLPAPSSVEESPSVLLGWGEMWGRLHEQLDHLPAQEKEVFILCFFEGLSRAQAAQVLEIPPKQASRAYLHAVAKLGPVLESSVR